MAAITTVRVLPTGERNIVRLTRPICRAKLKCAVSPSDAVPEISVGFSITVLGTLPWFGQDSTRPRLSRRGADDFGGAADQGHRILVETRACAAIDDHAAQRSSERRT